MMGAAALVVGEGIRGTSDGWKRGAIGCDGSGRDNNSVEAYEAPDEDKCSGDSEPARETTGDK